MYTFKLDHYVISGTVCILVYLDGELLGKLSSYVPTRLEPNEFCAKTYSENASWAPEVLALPHFIDTGEVVITGDVTWPIYELSLEFINEQFEATYNPRTDIYEAPKFLWSLYEKYVGEVCPPSTS